MRVTLRNGNKEYIQTGDRFQRYSYNKDGQVVKNGILECTHINQTRHFFKCHGCTDYPDGYMIRVTNSMMGSAFFNTSPGMDKL